MQHFETFEVREPEVVCDGGTLGHPRVYLHIDELHHDSTVQCPYCSRLYVMKKDNRTHAA